MVPPVHLTTTFIRDPDNQYRSGNVYGRPDNETVREAEAVIAALEGAAAAMVLRLRHVGRDRVVPGALAGRPRGRAEGHVLVAPQLAPDRGHALGPEGRSRGHVRPRRRAAAVRPGATKLIWIETPSNPLWSITDIAAAAEIAHAAGAVLAVDSTAPRRC